MWRSVCVKCGPLPLYSSSLSRLCSSFTPPCLSPSEVPQHTHPLTLSEPHNSHFKPCSCLHRLLSIGKGDDTSIVAAQSSSRVIDDIICGLPKQADTGTGGAGSLQLPCIQSMVVARDDVHAALRSLATVFKSSRARSRGSAGSAGSRRRSSEEGNTSVGSNSSHSSLPPRNRTVPKIVYSISESLSVSKEAKWV